VFPEHCSVGFVAMQNCNGIFQPSRIAVVAAVDLKAAASNWHAWHGNIKSKLHGIILEDFILLVDTSILLLEAIIVLSLDEMTHFVQYHVSPQAK
jgi:hypothetical protein